MTSTQKLVGAAPVPRRLRTVMAYGRGTLRLFAFASLLLTSASVFTSALAQPPTKARKELASMIDDMANRNPAPDVVRTRARARPVFADDYDWDEDKRARRAFWSVRDDDREELWEELLKHFDDKRYAWTAEINGASVTRETVAGLCMLLAYDRLRSPFERWLPVNEIGRPVRPDLGFGRDFTQWRKERADKSLYELQIEVCESAIKSLKTEGRRLGASDRQIRESCEKIQERIVQLRHEKRPFFRRLILDSYYHYKQEDAERIRKELKTKQAAERKSRP